MNVTLGVLGLGSCGMFCHLCEGLEEPRHDHPVG